MQVIADSDDYSQEDEELSLTITEVDTSARILIADIDSRSPVMNRVIFVELVVNGQVVNFQVATGATCNIVHSQLLPNSIGLMPV